MMYVLYVLCLDGVAAVLAAQSAWCLWIPFSCGHCAKPSLAYLGIFSACTPDAPVP